MVPVRGEFENKLVKTKAEYDKEEGTLTLKTKTLSSYVISDKELKTKLRLLTAIPTIPLMVPPDRIKRGENPATGSVDFVNVAVALAVVSW